MEDIIASQVQEVEVKSASSAQEALETIKLTPIDLILLDINMPVIDGFEFAKILKKNDTFSNIPIIFITASSNTNEFMQKGFDLGAIDYIQKPFDEILLVNKIRSYVKLFKKEKELQRAYAMINAILSHMDSLICIINENEILHANETFLKFFAFPSLENFQKKHTQISDFFVLDDDKILPNMDNKAFIEYFLENSSKDIKIHLYDNSLKKERFFIAKCSALYKENENKEYILSLTDITETEKLKNSYQMQAVIDSLTQIYNRQAFNDKYPKELYYALTHQKNLGLIMADIDHFKRINDTYNHQVGDSVLKEFCKVINKTIPNNYFFARWGGEEFIIICKDDTKENILSYAELCRAKIEENEFLHVGHVSASFGVSFLQENDDDESLLSRVDEALYIAKAGGRNQVSLK